MGFLRTPEHLKSLLVGGQIKRVRGLERIRNLLEEVSFISGGIGLWNV